MNIKSDQSGLAHLGLIVISLLVVGAIGFAGYRVMESKNEIPGSQEISINDDESNDSSSEIDQADEPEELSNVSTSEDQ